MEGKKLMNTPDKTLYIMRHGQTDLNKNGIVQGRGMNTDLNSTGILQAQAFYKMYQNVPFDKIYTSVLKRTHQTVQPFIDQGIAWEQLDGLDEMCWGDLEGKSNTPEAREIFLQLAALWQGGNYAAKTEGGESPEEVQMRLNGAMEYILSRKNEKTILICMHGRAMRLLLCTLLQKPLSEMPDFPHQNTTLYKLSLSGKIFTIDDFNNFTHLETISE